MFTDFKGFAGYLLDLYRLVMLNFTNPHGFTKFRIIDSIRKRTGSSVLLEAGTYRGVTTRRCSYIFKNVYTAELGKVLAAQASAYLRDRKNVRVIQGDALEILPGLLKSAEIDNVLIFLDGHFSGGETVCGSIPEPAVEGLKVLSEHKGKIKAIIVDDFRCFGTVPNFPTKSILLKTAEDHFSNFGFELIVQLDQLIIMRNS